MPSASTPEPQSVQQVPETVVRIGGIEGARLNSATEITVPGGEIGSQTAIVSAEPGAIRSGASAITFSIADTADDKVAVTEQSKFWMP